jgi:hypothetical protein
MEEATRILRKKNRTKKRRTIEKSYKRWSEEENAMYAFFILQN